MRSIITIKAVAILLVSLFLCAPVAEAAPEDAQKIMQDSVTRILGIIKSPDYKDAAKRKQLNKKIEQEVYQVFDFEEFSQRTVGVFWKKFTPAQQKSFTDAFAALLFATYLDRLDGYGGETITYDGIVVGNKGTRVEVRTMLTMKNKQKIPMNYRMLPKDGTWRVYDVLVEGVSLVKNYRTQFNDALQSDTPEALIERVRERTKAIAGASYDN